MKLASGEPYGIEEGVLADAGLSMTHFPKSGPLKCTGGRRPLRFIPKDCAAKSGQDDNGEYIELTFTLGPGCYATSVLREICKEGLKVRVSSEWDGEKT